MSFCQVDCIHITLRHSFIHHRGTLIIIVSELVYLRLHIWLDEVILNTTSLGDGSSCFFLQSDWRSWCGYRTEKGKHSSLRYEYNLNMGAHLLVTNIWNVSCMVTSAAHFQTAYTRSLLNSEFSSGLMLKKRKRRKKGECLVSFIHGFATLMRCLLQPCTVIQRIKTWYAYI